MGIDRKHECPLEADAPNPHITPRCQRVRGWAEPHRPPC